MVYKLFEYQSVPESTPDFITVTYTKRNTHKSLCWKSKAMVQLISETENSKSKQMNFSGGNIWLSLAGYRVFDKKD